MAKEYFTKQELKERGWTTKMIDRFLPDPDDMIANMRHKYGPPVYQYKVWRVLNIEMSDDFQEEQAKHYARTWGKKRKKQQQRE